MEETEKKALETEEAADKEKKTDEITVATSSSKFIPEPKEYTIDVLIQKILDTDKQYDLSKKRRCLNAEAAPFQLVKEASQSFGATRRNRVQSFSAAACTPRKILLSLQVCSLSATGGQRARAVRLQILVGKAFGFFDSLKGRGIKPRP